MLYNFLIICLCSVGIVNAINTSSERQEKPPYIDFLWALRETMNDTTCIDRIINAINKEFNEILNQQAKLDNEIDELRSQPLNAVSAEHLIAIENEWQELEIKKSDLVNRYSKQALECATTYQRGKNASSGAKKNVQELADDATSTAKKIAHAVDEEGHTVLEKGRNALTEVGKDAKNLAHKAVDATKKAARDTCEAGNRAAEKGRATLSEAKDIAKDLTNKAVEKGKNALTKAKDRAKDLTHRAAEATEHAAHTVGEKGHEAVEKTKTALIKVKDGVKDLTHKAVDATKHATATVCKKGSKVFKKDKIKAETT